MSDCSDVAVAQRAECDQTVVDELIYGGKMGCIILSRRDRAVEGPGERQFQSTIDKRPRQT